MALRSGFISHGDRRWLDVLEHIPHDVHHLPPVLETMARSTTSGEISAFVAADGDDVFFMPLAIRRIPESDGLVDAMSPQVFAGPLAGGSGSHSADFVDKVVAAFRKDFGAQGGVSALVRLHPLLSPSEELFKPHGELARHVDSVTIDLTLSEDEQWQQIRSNHRRDIRKAIARGYTVRMENEWESLPEFFQTYNQSMERLAVEVHSRLDIEQLSDLRRALGDHGHLCVAEYRGDVVGGAIVTEIEGLVEYHIAGTADSHTRESPSKLVIQSVIEWARSRGNRILHLGGTPLQNKSLLNFKLGFSSNTYPVHSLRVIADQDAYADLAAKRLEVIGAPEDPGYFPAYRAN